MSNMTKKIAIILVPLTAVIVFVALCTAQVISFKPNNVSNEAWSYSKSAYQLASDAIAGKTDYPTASDRMKDMAESINTSSGGSAENAANAQVQTCIVGVATDLSILDNNEKSGHSIMTPDVEKNMKALAKAIGY